MVHNLLASVCALKWSCKQTWLGFSKWGGRISKYGDSDQAKEMNRKDGTKDNKRELMKKPSQGILLY